MNEEATRKKIIDEESAARAIKALEKEQDILSQLRHEQQKLFAL